MATFPHIKTIDSSGGLSIPHVLEDSHILVRVEWEEGGKTEYFCGETWCSGNCGVPALVVKVENREFKAYSNMTAVGPLMQPFRVTWRGSRVEVPEQHIEDLLKRMWW